MNPKLIEQMVSDWLSTQLANTSVKEMFKPITDETRGSRRSKQADPDVVGKAIGHFTSKLLIAIAPLASFATILSASTSGLSVFVGAINILAMTVAPILLPFFILFGAALLAISAVLWEQLEPALGDFYEWIAVTAVDALEQFVDWVRNAYESIIDWKAGLDESIENIGRQAESWDMLDLAIHALLSPLMMFIDLMYMAAGEKSPIQGGIDWLREKAGIEKGEKVKDKRDRFIGREDGPEKEKQPGKPSKFSGEFVKGIRDMVNQFRFQNMPKAQMTGIVQASRSVQMAALNVSPFEQKQLKMMGDVIKLLDKLANAAEKRAKERAGDD